MSKLIALVCTSCIFNILVVTTNGVRIEMGAGPDIEPGNEPIAAPSDGPEQSENMYQPNFVMPGFDELAKVRGNNLKAVGVNKGAADFVVSAMPTGISKAKWNSDNMGVKIGSFEKYAAGKATMDFEGFFAMYAAGAIAKDKAECTARVPTIEATEAEIEGWLVQKQYSQGVGWAAYRVGNIAKQVAEGFLSANHKKEDLGSLALFAELDDDHNTGLSFKEIAACMKVSPVDPDIKVYDWSDIAKVEDADFKGLGFPKLLIGNILSTFGTGGGTGVMSLLGPTGGLTSEQFSGIQKEITHYIKLGISAPGDDKFDGTVSFPDLASTSPSPEKCPGGVKATGFTLGGEVANDSIQPIVMPSYSLEDFLPEGSEGRLEIGQDDIAHWLQTRSYTSNVQPFSLQILTWGNETMGSKNGKLQGPAAGKERDQVSNIAPRLALFEALDVKHQGYLDFSDCINYMKILAAGGTMKPTCESTEATK